MSRKNKKDFTRDRIIGVDNLIVYNLNNRGISNKAELKDFIKITDMPKVSASALLKQRAKLNPDVFKMLDKELSICFYNDCKDEVKTFKGYVLTSTDGSDIEVPNTEENRERYQSKNSENTTRVARAKLSCNYDVLNLRILDTEVEEYKHGEVDLARRHQTYVKELIGKFKTIEIRDRGYFSLSDFYYLMKNNQSFVVRLNTSYLKQEVESMTKNDEEIEIKYQYDRIRNYKDKDPEFYKYYMNKNTISLRLVKIKLSTGEDEILITNLGSEFTTDDLREIYRLRWEIETNYNLLKNSIKLCNISSSIENIVLQEIYSTVLVCNMLQSITNEAQANINQKKYKYAMDINRNMAAGAIKKALINILVEVDENKRSQLMSLLFDEIFEEIVPIRGGRKYPRNKASDKNKYPITNRVTY